MKVKRNYVISIILVMFFVNVLRSNELPYWGWETVYQNFDPRNLVFGNADTLHCMTTQLDPYGQGVYKDLIAYDKGVNFTTNGGTFSSVNGTLLSLDHCLSFIDAKTGWFSYYDGNYLGSMIYKTTNCGYYWTAKYSNTQTVFYGSIKFVNENTGYLWKSPQLDSKLYKTINAGVSWAVVYEASSSEILITDLAISPNNSDVVYIVGRHWNQGANYFYPLFVKSYDAFATYTVVCDGQSDPWVLRGINCVSVLNSEGSDVVKIGTTIGVGQQNSNNTISIIGHPVSALTGVSYIKAISNNYVMAGVYDQNQAQYFCESKDGGYNWQTVYNVASTDHLSSISSVGDVSIVPIYNSIYGGTFLLRKIGMNINTNFDWHGGVGSITIDQLDERGTNDYSTPRAFELLHGGTMVFSEKNPIIKNSNNDTVAQFYYWGGDLDLSMCPDYDKAYLINIGKNINADYKSNSITTTQSAIKYSPQTKTIKDTAGVINLVYESMEGIFFTRSKPDGNFKSDEIVSGTIANPFNSGYATFKNKNPYLTEIRMAGSSQPLTNQYPEQNVACVWERYNPSTQKNEIVIAKRTFDINGVHGWAKDYTSGPNYLTTFSATSDFESKPKVFCSTYGLLDGNYIYVVPHLEPYANGQKKIIVTVRYQNYYHDYEIDNGNISDLAAIAPYNYYGVFGVHFVYLKDNQILYKYAEFGYNSGLYYQAYQSLNKIVSDIEMQSYRYSPDITLRNVSVNPSQIEMQPVVSYQGQYQARVIIGGVGTGSMDVNYFPIIIRERQAGGTWASQNIQYNSSINQQFPQIEGSKTRNSYILNYGQNNSTYFQRLPRWEGSTTSGYYCSPVSYAVSDAKFVRGALINQTSTNQTLITLSPENSIYKLEKQPSTITNNQQVGDGAFDGVQGIVVVDNMKYSFNLGSIMVNSSMVDFTPQLDSNFNNINQLNSSMRSNNFLLNVNDTLVLGRDAFYLPGDSAGTFQGIEYWVDLYTSHNILHSNLIHDTLHVNDTIHLEYLDGFVISNIRNGSDSFYVQLRIDTVHANSIGGGDISNGDGPTGLGNKLGIQKKIFWHDGRQEKQNVIPTVFNLYQNYPNPFNPSTTIKYDLPKDVNVTIKVYDLLGRELTRLVNNEMKKAGSYSVQWNALNFASGVYICRIKAGDYVNVKKMVMLK